MPKTDVPLDYDRWPVPPRVTPIARMLVFPRCPACGSAALFTRRSSSVGELVPVECDSCSWRGVAPETVPIPAEATRPKDYGEQ